uniref:Uncharacterized protein n=1 Tax=Brassica oleracea var. oleracea TaxID=109376 RepID=A0A0D3AWM7_BRAOL
KTARILREKNRRNNVILTIYRRNKSSEIIPRNFFFPRKSLGIFRRNSEEIPRITSLSEISSKYTEGELRRDISSEGHEHVPRYIPRNMSLGIFRGKVSLGIFRGKVSLDQSMDLCPKTHRSIE